MTRVTSVSVCSVLLSLLIGFSVSIPAFAQQPAGGDRPIHDYEACVYLLVASNDATRGATLPPMLAGVQKQVLSMVQLGALRLGTSFVYRVKSLGNIQASGVTGPVLPITTSASTPAFYSLALRSIDDSTASSGKPAINIGRFDFNLRIPIVAGRVSADSGSEIQYENVGTSTDLRVPIGEPVIASTITTGRPDELFVIVLLVKALQ